MTDIDYNLIIENNRLIIHELINYFKNNNKITIIGKSETAHYIKNAIGINQGLIFTNYKFLFINDFELYGMKGIVYHPDLKLLNFKKPENYEDLFEKYMIFHNNQFNTSNLKGPRKHNFPKGVNISLN